MADTAAKPSPHLTIRYDVDLPEEVVRQFLDSIQDPRIEIEVQGRKSTPQANLEWNALTAVAVIIGTTLLQEVVKDCFKKVKEGFKGLWPVFFGPNAKSAVRMIGSNGVIPTTYSLSLSIMAEDGRFRLLLPSEVSQQDYEAGLDCFFDLTSAYHSKALTREAVQVLDENRTGTVTLLVYDPTNGKLRPVNGLTGRHTDCVVEDAELMN